MKTIKLKQCCIPMAEIDIGFRDFDATDPNPPNKEFWVTINNESYEIFHCPFCGEKFIWLELEKD